MTATAEEALTSPGTALGTVAYMSPEQALGKELDARTDIFSLGVVLYEMSTGVPPFRGTTSAATFNAILNSAPPAPVRINPDLPVELERIIHKALEKDREVRYQHASDLRADLRRLKRDTDSGREAAVREQGVSIKKEGRAGRWRWALAGLALVVLAGLGVTWFAMRRMQPPPELRQRRLTANPSESPVGMACVSRDGKYLVYSDWMGMHIQVIESGETTPVSLPPGTAPEGAKWYPQGWFPDDTKFVAQLAEAGGQSSAWVVSALGAPPRKLRDNADAYAPSPDGSTILLLSGARQMNIAKEVWRMGSQGEEPRLLWAAAENEWFGWPVWSPTGRRIAYPRYYAGAGSIESRDVGGGPPTSILQDPKLQPLHSICWLHDGRVIFTTIDSTGNQPGPSLWAIEVDVTTGRPRSRPKCIRRWEEGFALLMNASADGRRLVVTRGSIQSDVYVGQLEAGGRFLTNLRRLTFDEHNDYATAWTPDSKAVLFHSDRNGQNDIFRQALDRDTAEPVVTGPGSKHDPKLSSEGSWILFIQDVPGGKSRIMRVPVKGASCSKVPPMPDMLRRGISSFFGAGYSWPSRSTSAGWS